MPALLAMISVKDYIYAAIIVFVIAAGGYEHHHLIVEGAAREKAAVEEASLKTQADAEAKVAKITADHTDEISNLKDTYAKQHEIDAAQYAADSERLRQFAAARSPRKAVDSATGGPADTGDTIGFDPELNARLTSLEQVAKQLAASLRDSVNSLQECMEDRDSLTGK